jgi:UDP-N-acetylmuramoylalanine--D-glutamate ligase
MVAVLDTLQLAIAALATRAAAIAVPEHRLQCVATIDGVHFYNDSKATIPQATLAAVDKIGSSSIILLWGGVSKGVDRIPYIKQLASRVKYIICFGKEAAQLYQGCLDNRIPAIAVATLQEAVTHAVGQAKPGDHILFSPAGASYDLFQDYEKRGEAFLQLVANLTSCFK